MNTDFIVNSPTTMISAIRECGFIPFFKSGIAGWSIEEMTDQEYWFTSSDQLGLWDWKISVIRERLLTANSLVVQLDLQRLSFIAT